MHRDEWPVLQFGNLDLRKIGVSIWLIHSALRARTDGRPFIRADCAPGTCYEGSCLGDKVYSTDGTCGVQHGRRRCAGKWGDCCNLDGKCGSGTDFCGWMKCQSGNCIIPRSASWRPSRPLLSGNTTDGTCGGKDDYVCNEVFGLCCNKSGRCGGGPSDCGVGW